MPNRLIFIQKKLLSILVYIITIANIVASSKESQHSILRMLISSRIIYYFTVIDNRKENER